MTIAGRYQLETLLAEGGMGLVFRARHLVLDQVLALKLVRPDFIHHPVAVARFLDEARAIARLTSPHVAHVLDSGTAEDGTPYMALELLHGSDLRTRLECSGPLSCEDAAGYVVQACRAVAEAHELGIVHRDLKPENLFLHRLPDGSSIIKVLDFGISKFLDHPPARSDGRAHTVEGETVGSLHYMSPEQISARGVDARTDIWSLGVVLFELVTDRVPFEGENIGQVCAALFAGEAPDLCTLRPDIPREFAEIVSRCLRKTPSERYWHVGELSEALTAFLNGDRSLTESAFTSERPTLISVPPPEPEIALGTRVRRPRRARSGWLYLGLTALLATGAAAASRVNFEPFAASTPFDAASLSASHPQGNVANVANATTMARAPEPAASAIAARGSVPVVPVQVEPVAPLPAAPAPKKAVAPASNRTMPRAASPPRVAPVRPTSVAPRAASPVRGTPDELIPPYGDAPELRAEANEPRR
jgi:serine/threonine-protein kinase